MIKATKKNGKIIILMTDGHKKALDEVIEEYELKNEEEALSFMLSVVLQENIDCIDTEPDYEPEYKITEGDRPYIGDKPIDIIASNKPNGQYFWGCRIDDHVLKIEKTSQEEKEK